MFISTFEIAERKSVEYSSLLKERGCNVAAAQNPNSHYIHRVPHMPVSLKSSPFFLRNIR